MFLLDWVRKGFTISQITHIYTYSVADGGLLKIPLKQIITLKFNGCVLIVDIPFFFPQVLSYWKFFMEQLLSIMSWDIFDHE